MDNNRVLSTLECPDPMDYILKLIDQYPPLTAIEEKQLISKMLAEGKEDELRSRLVLHNIALIPKAMRKYKHSFPSKPDMFMYGIETLTRLSHTFDFNMKCRFDSYAFNAIWKDAAKIVKTLKTEVDRRSFSLDAPIKNDEGDASPMLDLIQTRIIDSSEFNSIINSKPWKKLDTDSVINHIYRVLRRRFKDKYIKAVLEYWLMPTQEKNLDKVTKKYKLSYENTRKTLYKMRSFLYTYANQKLNGKQFTLHTPVLSDFEVVKYKDSLQWNGKTKRYEIVRIKDLFNSTYDYDAYQHAVDDYNEQKNKYYQKVRNNLTSDYLLKIMEVFQAK